MTQPRKHRHAEMIKRWLDDDSLIPQFNHTKHGWITTDHPAWSELDEYRFKPKMIAVGELEFPEPMRVAPIYDSVYWSATFDIHGIPSKRWQWIGDESDCKRLHMGLCHATKAAAEQHAKALIALTESKS